ncbi:hypothetical protein C2G38_2136869 [Gigaspora rosea]|uniref:Uncharacterized protein n=1 Tax=Gigaspora rosea TaxID=44941 RepID=A0A397W744_9GLOM|nr:hypothetical protein C2G38_2136869 [Gigaspora rosea]
MGEKRKIQPEHLQKYRFVYRCELLGNEDLVMITVIGLLIWMVWPKKEIKLRYYKGFPFTSSYLNKKDFNDRYISGAYVNKKSEYKKLEFFAKKPHIRKLLEEICDHRENLLSPPDFDAIVPYYEELCMNKGYPFKELIDDYIENKITLILYGQQLLRSFLNNKNYLMAEKLYRQCIKINIEDEKIDFLTNIKLLEIITFSFVELSQKFPDLLKEFLSHTSFIISSENKDLAIRNFSSASHLQNHRKYPQPFKTSFINNLFNFCQEIKLLSLNFLEGRIFKRLNEHPSIIMIFPLPKFNSYPSTYSSWKELILPNFSPFTKYKSSELYKQWNGEVLLNFKWNNYGKYYYFAIWIFFNFYGMFFDSFYYSKWNVQKFSKTAFNYNYLSWSFTPYI